MTNKHKITRHCEILARKSKQSISAIRESKAIRLLYANLWLDLLIHFYNITRIHLSDSRGLDCHENATHFLAMTNGTDCFGDKSPRNDSKNSPSLAEGDKGGGLKAQKNSGVKFNNKSTHPLTPSAREIEFFTSLTLFTKESK